MYTLTEYDLHYSLKDVCDAHEALDLKEAAEAHSMQQHESRMRQEARAIRK